MQVRYCSSTAGIVLYLQPINNEYFTLFVDDDFITRVYPANRNVKIDPERPLAGTTHPSSNVSFDLRSKFISQCLAGNFLTHAFSLFR